MPTPGGLFVLTKMDSSEPVESEAVMEELQNLNLAEAKPGAIPHKEPATAPYAYFVKACNCKIGEKLATLTTGSTNVPRIKEATTGNWDSVNQQNVGNFVTYVIEFNGEKEEEAAAGAAVRRRYTDFEFLATHLNRTYPYWVIPPIPDKETLGEILSSGLKGVVINQGRSKDPHLIQHRIRLFQSFLRNVALHPGLCGDHYVHRFISEIGEHWSEGITMVDCKLPFSIQSGSISGRRLRVPDPLFVRLEEMNAAYRAGTRSIQSGQRRLLKRLKDESRALSDLGAAFNAFSLEYEALAGPLEIIGQNADAEVVDLHALIRNHETLSDSLKEIVLFSDCIHRCLKNHQAKRIDLEEFYDQINAKKNSLMQMESNVKVESQDSTQHNQINRAKHTIDELEKSKKQRQSEMAEYTTRTLQDVNRIFEYFGKIWRKALKTLAECQCKWHESAMASCSNI